MVTTKLNLSMTEPSVRQIYAKQGDTRRVLDITLDQTPEDGTLRILRPDGTEVTSEANTGGEVSESGETVSFESLAEAEVTELTVGIEPVQDLNGYDNPWVGGGYINLCDNSALTIGYYNNSGTYIHTSDGSFYTTPLIAVSANTAYCASFFDDTGTRIDGLVWTEWDANEGFIGQRTSGAITTGSTTAYIRLRNYSAQSSIMISKGTDVKWQLEKGSTWTSYSPYSNICPITGHDEVTVNFGAEQGAADETYTTSLGQTVYGGTLDVVSGVLTVTHAMVDLGTLNWERTTTSAGTYRFYSGSLGSVIKKPTTMTETSDLDCSQYVATYGNAPNASVQGICIHTNGNLMVYDSTLDTATVADFTTAMDGVTCVYPLATPVEYQLTAQQIETLVGENDVWASSGDIVNITFAYDGLMAEIPSEATSIVGKCYCDVEQNGVSSMPFTLNVKKNERQ